MTIREHADILVDLVPRLTDLLTRETQALLAHEFETVSALQDDKARLCRAYEDSYRAVKAEGRQLADDAPEAAARLRVLENDFRHAMAENLRAVKAARKLNDRILQAVRRALTRHQNPAASYSAQGTHAVTGRGSAMPALAVSFNQTA